MKFGVGQSVPRSEDPRFLKGRGRYVSDIAPYGQAHGFVLRSPHAHAKIKSIDVSKAKAAPGVLLALTLPLKRSGADTKDAPAPLHRLEHALHPWSAWLVLPAFGFANAGVSLAGVLTDP